MTNTKLLKSKMILYGDENFVQCTADLLNCSRVTASKKINGEKTFSQLDIIKFAEKYNLSADDINNIFIGVD